MYYLRRTKHDCTSAKCIFNSNTRLLVTNTGRSLSTAQSQLQIPHSLPELTMQAGT